MEHPVNIYMTAGSLITSLGFGLEENVKAIRSSRSGIVRVNDRALFEEPFPAARIDAGRLAEQAEEAGLSEYTRMEQLFLLCLNETILQSGVDPASPECGLILSTTKGNIGYLRKEPDSLPEAGLYEMGRKIASRLQCVHEPVIVSNACISGVSALIIASRLVEAGMYKQVLVAGGDLLTRFVVTGFQSFKSVSPTVCRPYDRERDGLSLGEACGAVLVTAESHQVKEKQPVVIAGGAITNDANHISGPSRTGDGLYYAVSQALEEAALTPDEVSFVNAHGTATLYNDEMESKAFHWACLDTVPLNSLKSYWGHTLGASGIIESIICLEELRYGEVWGTKGYETPGIPFPLHISNATMTVPMKACVKTASGFGGCNGAIVFAVAEKQVAKREYSSKEVKTEVKPEWKSVAEFSPCGKKKRHVTRCVKVRENRILLNGKILFEGNPQEDFSSFIRNAYKALGFEDRKFYKMDDLCKLGYIAVGCLLQENGGTTGYAPGEVGIVLSNASSSLDTDLKHQRIIETEGDREASPAVFVYTLPNVVMGEICIRYKIQGENTFFISPDYPAAFIRRYAELVMEKRKLKACLIGWCEYLDGQYEARFEWLEQIN